MENLTKQQKKTIKGTLEHINGCFFVFKHHAISKGIEDEVAQTELIQQLLRNYLSSEKFITEDKILKCKELVA